MKIHQTNIRHFSFAAAPAPKEALRNQGYLAGKSVNRCYNDDDKSNGDDAPGGFIGDYEHDSCNSCTIM